MAGSALAFRWPDGRELVVQDGVSVSWRRPGQRVVQLSAVPEPVRGAARAALPAHFLPTVSGGSRGQPPELRVSGVLRGGLLGWRWHHRHSAGQLVHRRHSQGGSGQVPDRALNQESVARMRWVRSEGHLKIAETLSRLWKDSLT